MQDLGNEALVENDGNNFIKEENEQKGKKENSILKKIGSNLSTFGTANKNKRPDQKKNAESPSKNDNIKKESDEVQNGDLKENIGDEIKKIDSNNNKNIINEKELFFDIETDAKTNKNDNDDSEQHLKKSVLLENTENDMNTTTSVKSTESLKTCVISKNGEVVVEPLMFEEKLRMWKGTINSIQEKKEDEKKQQEERLRQLETLKLVHNLNKEEQLLHKEYLEQLKKDEELATQIEEELNAEIKKELHEIEKRDFQLAQELQKESNIHCDFFGRIGGSMKQKSNTKTTEGENCSSMAFRKSKTRILKEKFQNLFKKKSSA